MEKDRQLYQLFQKFIDNSINKDEYDLLLKHFGSDLDRSELQRLILDRLTEDRETEDPEGLHKTLRNVDTTLRQMIDSDRSEKSIIKKIYPYIAAAALLVIGVFAYNHFVTVTDTSVQIGLAAVDDVDPGTNRATLTLEDGTAIALSEEQAGIVIDDRGIAYTDGTDIVQAQTAQYAILTTPRKGQYKATLPDGTQVWLNAESSLRYPTAFTGGERYVELEGEAYFEVAHRADQPFIVQTKGQRLKVLGTSFNLNAYPNEPATTTTLVTGRVELNESNILKPSEQAVLGSRGYQIQTVDTAPYVAWKEGSFRFRATPLPEALRQLERWYDLEIDYSDIPDDIKVHASIQRDKKLSSVLYALEEISQVKFEIKGRRLILMR